jgi:hypothetical protein
MAPEMNGLRRRHHADVALDREVALSRSWPHGLAQSKTGQVLGLEAGAPSSVMAPQT